jgi:hypothetical protein
MTTTTSPNPKHYRLNAKQLHYLKLIYKFRFVTTTLLSQYKNKQETTTTYLALKNLREQDYIGRHYDMNYKLRGQAASYYLLSNGMKALKTHGIGTPKVFKNSYKDQTVTEQFIIRCLSLFEIYNHIRNLYDKQLVYYSKNELAPSKYDYFPKKRPDAYITLPNESGVKPREYFMEYFEDAKPIITHVGRIRQYIKYAGSKDWNKSGTLPPILLVCETAAVEHGLHKRLIRLPGSLKLQTTVKGRLIASKDGAAWCTAEDPNTMLALPDIA